MASRPLPLPLWDRKAGKVVDEFMDDAASTYESQPQRSLNQWLKSHPLYDWILAAYQNSRLSRRKIAPFIRKHDINMTEFEPVSYRSYAEFFERRFRPGARRFPAEPAAMGAFAEARYLAWDHIDAAQEFPVKGRSLDAAQLLGSASPPATSPAARSFSRDSRRWITTTSTTLITAGLSVTIAWVDAYGP
jgi:phosphatidylserine decarboxylase